MKYQVSWWFKDAVEGLRRGKDIVEGDEEFDEEDAKEIMAEIMEANLTSDWKMPNFAMNVNSPCPVSWNPLKIVKVSVGSATVGKASSGARHAGDEVGQTTPSKGLTILPSSVDSREPVQKQSLPKAIQKMLDEGMTVCLGCGYVGTEIQGKYPDLYEGYGCPVCHSALVMVSSKLKEKEATI